MNMIYLVVSSFGEYDEKWQRNDSAWGDLEKAEARIKQLSKELSILRQIPMPEFDSSNMNQETYDLYMEWDEKTAEAREYNRSWIEKFEVQ